MTHVVGVLAESMISSSKVEDISLILSDSNIMLDFINEICNVAESIAIDEHGVLKNMVWSWLKVNGDPGMVYTPEYDAGQTIVVKTPFKTILTDDEYKNPIVTPKTFGLICTMIATVSILAQLKEKRERDSGSDKKMLGLIKRRLEANIDFFVEFYANLDASLNKTRDLINSKEPSENIHRTPVVADFNSISALVDSYSTLRVLETRA
ncbi:hypothetical protein [Psychrobacter sp. UBA3480]|uniref:hypothetical protein n=1 Tax=Psychrobacter sp. UBA3480 TaxID=1947350 RepID=UPI0025D20569|nr:hypothetical protein [Psychrobacter sp. UBA3480]